MKQSAAFVQTASTNSVTVIVSQQTSSSSASQLDPKYSHPYWGGEVGILSTIGASTMFVSGIIALKTYLELGDTNSWRLWKNTGSVCIGALMLLLALYLKYRSSVITEEAENYQGEIPQNYHEVVDGRDVAKRSFILNALISASCYIAYANSLPSNPTNIDFFNQFQESMFSDGKAIAADVFLALSLGGLAWYIYYRSQLSPVQEAFADWKQLSEIGQTVRNARVETLSTI